MGARTTPGSGALAGAKGDSIRADLLIESKSTIHDSLALKLSWLQKINAEALAKNRAPALTVSFVTTNGESKRNGDWVALPMWYAKQIGLVP